MMIPFSFFADSKIRSFVYKRDLHKEHSNLQELGDKMLSFLDSSWVKEKLPVFQEMDELYINEKCGFIDFYHSLYPKLLKEIYDPPLVLFYTGNPEILSLDYSAVVGTRKASAISLFATRKLVESLEFQNKERLVSRSYGSQSTDGMDKLDFKIIKETTTSFGIVSGMALGIDKEAMQTSLNCSIPTLGVLGTPAYAEYPFGNLALYKEMKTHSNTCLISELLPMDRYAKWTFPMRNRIITGIAKHIFLMETPIQSGAMSSANNAINQNKEIYVFCDPRQENNEGGKQLVADGAQMFTVSDLNMKGTIKHITELSSSSSILQSGSSTTQDNTKTINLSFHFQAEHIGNGYYFIENN